MARVGSKLVGRLAGRGGFLLLLLAAFAQTRDVSISSAGSTMRVRLLAPLTSKFNRKGDMVSACVVEPSGLAGAILEGEIRDLRAGGPGKASAVQFEFHTLHSGDKTVPVAASIVEVSNSQRKFGVDEDGSPIEGAGHAGSAKVVGTSPRGASPRLVVKNGPLSLASGSELVLEVQPRRVR